MKLSMDTFPSFAQHGMDSAFGSPAEVLAPAKSTTDSNVHTKLTPNRTYLVSHSGRQITSQAFQQRAQSVRYPRR